MKLYKHTRDLADDNLYVVFDDGVKIPVGFTEAVRIFHVEEVDVGEMDTEEDMDKKSDFRRGDEWFKFTSQEGRLDHQNTPHSTRRTIDKFAVTNPACLDKLGMTDKLVVFTPTGKMTWDQWTELQKKPDGQTGGGKEGGDKK